MKIRQITVQHIRIPMRIRFAQANNAVDHSSSVIVIVETENGIRGYGEACPRLYVTGETPQSVEDDISVNSPLICSLNIDSIEEIRDLVLNQLPFLARPAAICGMELALLDALGKERQDTVFELFGLELPPVLSYSGVIPTGNIEVLEPLLRRFNFKDIKIKLDKDLINGLGRVRYIRTLFGNDVSIRADLNEAWTPEIARQQIPLYLHHGVSSFEQIFPATEETALRKITEEFGSHVSIMLDESLTTIERARYLIENRLGNHFNLKISKHGGIFHTLEICRLAYENGIKCQLGAHFGETSILTAAGMVVAGMFPELTNREGAMGTWLLEMDICTDPWMTDVWGHLPTSVFNRPDSGWGITLSEERLRLFAESPPVEMQPI